MNEIQAALQALQDIEQEAKNAKIYAITTIGLLVFIAWRVK